MAAFTTAAIVGAAVVGAAATGYAVTQQKRAAKRQARMIERQEEQAKLEARERAGLDAARDDTGADIRLGRGEGAAPSTTGGAGQGASTRRAGAVGARVGGMGQPARASRRVGL